jgi:hypothetical protein
MKEFNLDNVKEVLVKNGVVMILYEDGTKHTIKDDVKLIKNIINQNEGPIVDHCI